MVVRENHDRIIVNPDETDENKIFDSPSWLMASRQGRTPKDELPTDGDDPFIIKENVTKLDVILKKWGLQAASLVTGLVTLVALGSIPSALTVDTIGRNFEISQAPDVTAAIALGCLGLMTAVVSRYTHKAADSWRKIQGWMKEQRVKIVDIARTPWYWLGTRS